MAKPAKTRERHIVSGNSENMSSGLADNFDGRIEKVRTQPFRTKKGDIIPHVKVVIAAKDGETVTARYFLGFEAEKYFIPSEDGYDPIDLESFDPEDESSCEGLFIMPFDEDNVKPLSKKKSWGFFMESLRLAGFDVSVVDEDGGYSNLEGIYAHFDRLPEPASAGKVADDGEQKRRNDVLVVTELKDDPEKGRKGKTSKPAPAAAAKGKTAQPVDDDDDDSGESMEDQVAACVKTALSEAKNQTLSILKLTAAVGRTYEGPDPDKALQLVGKKGFLHGIEGVEFDADTKTATLSE